VNRSPVWSSCARRGPEAPVGGQRQQGIALPVVLAVLALGAMIVTPFLTHAATNLNGSRTYAQIQRELYTADAAVEQVIWDLRYGDLDSRLSSAGGSLSYTLSPLSDLTPSLTVTRSGAAGGSPGGAAGIITRPYLSRFQLDTAGYTPVMANAGGEIYAAAYCDEAGRLILKTISIDAAGLIDPVTLETLTVANSGYEPDIIQISEGIVAMVFRGASNKGYLTVIRINSDGTIGGMVVQPQAIVNNSAYTPVIIHVESEYYVVAYRGPCDKGYLQTVMINSAGALLNGNVSNYSFTGTLFEPAMVKLEGSNYAVAYRGLSNLGYLATFSINQNGVISHNVISSLSFSSGPAYTPQIVLTAPGITAVAYRGTGNQGYLTTLAIDSQGIIASPALDTQVFDSTAGFEPFIGIISGTVFAIFYRGSGNDGTIKTINNESDGSIGAAPVDSYVFDSAGGYEPYFIYISDSRYAAVYRGGSPGSTNVYAVTFEIVTDTTAAYRIVSTAGDTVVTAELELAGGLVNISKWSVQR